MDIREAIRTRPMRPFQVGIVTICVVLAMIDGYEVVTMPFTMPHLAKAWKLTPVEIGYLLSAGIFGMALGAAVVSPLADLIGRRRHILLCLAMITVGMALSALAQSVTQLVACAPSLASLLARSSQASTSWSRSTAPTAAAVP